MRIIQSIRTGMKKMAWDLDQFWRIHGPMGASLILISDFIQYRLRQHEHYGKQSTSDLESR